MDELPFRKVAGFPVKLIKLTLPHGRFSSFSNCTHGTKSGKVSHIMCTGISFDKVTEKTYLQLMEHSYIVVQTNK